MTITVRNRILGGSLLGSGVVLAAFVVVVLELYAAGPSFPFAQLLSDKNKLRMFLALARVAALLVFSLGAGFLLQRFFRKTVSSEMFFFIMFVISLSFEAFRAGQVWLQAANQPAYYGAILTRIVFFSRFFGVFCLLISGLYATGIQYQRFEIVLGIALLLAFALAFSIPVDASTFLPTLLYRVGDSVQLIAAFLALECFAAVSFLLAAYFNQTRNYLYMAIGIAAVIAGTDVLFFATGIVSSVAGFVLLIMGTIMFGNRTHVVYLWT